MNEHLKVYLKDANDFVDLTVHRFEYHNHEYMELKLLEVLIEVTDRLLDCYDNGFVNCEFKDSMNGVYTTSVNEQTIDESPFAYKPMDEIIKNIRDTVDIERIIKPIYNFKASE